jgi:hypothetical protein
VFRFSTFDHTLSRREKKSGTLVLPCNLFLSLRFPFSNGNLACSGSVVVIKVVQVAGNKCFESTVVGWDTSFTVRYLLSKLKIADWKEQGGYIVEMKHEPFSHLQVFDSYNFIRVCKGCWGSTIHRTCQTRWGWFTKFLSREKVATCCQICKLFFFLFFTLQECRLLANLAVLSCKHENIHLCFRKTAFSIKETENIRLYSVRDIGKHIFWLQKSDWSALTSQWPA